MAQYDHQPKKKYEKAMKYKISQNCQFLTFMWILFKELSIPDFEMFFSVFSYLYATVSPPRV
jgi:hypothetical protein